MLRTCIYALFRIFVVGEKENSYFLKSRVRMRFRAPDYSRLIVFIYSGGVATKSRTPVVF